MCGMVPSVRVFLGFGGCLTLELEEGCFKVSRHGDAHIFVDVVPLECEAEVFLPGPVIGDLVIFPEVSEQVFGVCLWCVLDYKVVENKGKTRSDVWRLQRDSVCGTGAYPFLARFLVSQSLPSVLACLSLGIPFLISM